MFCFFVWLLLWLNGKICSVCWHSFRYMGRLMDHPWFAYKWDRPTFSIAFVCHFLLNEKMGYTFCFVEIVLVK